MQLVASLGYNVAMPNVGIRELKNKLSEYLDQVEHGKRITITKRGKVVAVISPPVEYEASKDLSDLVKEESATWSGGKPQGSVKRPKVKGKSIADTVVEDRR